MESWALTEPRIRLRAKPASATNWPDETEQQVLCDTWGSGPTFALSESALRNLESAYGLRAAKWRRSDSLLSDIKTYLEERVPRSHIMLIYSRSPDVYHAVLVYRFDDAGAAYMDPDGGGHWHCSWSWFANRGPLITLRML